MKSSKLFAVIGLFITVTLLSSCTTWHYKHERVRIDAGYGVPSVRESNISPITPVAFEQAVQIVPEQSPVNESVNLEITPDPQMVSTTVDPQFQKRKQTADPDYFLQQLNNGRHLLKVKQVENTQLSGWLKIMIILFAVGLVLLILGAVLSAVVFGGFWWFFYLFGSLCILAGCIVLVLGLVGVMH